jgi:hypothetical protein
MSRTARLSLKCESIAHCHDHEPGLMKQANRIKELLVAYSPLPPQRHKYRKLRTASEDSFKVQSPRHRSPHLQISCTVDEKWDNG